MDENYTQRAFEIINNLEECAKEEYKYFSMDSESSKILMAWIHMQDNIITEMLKWIKTGNDFSDVSAKYKTEEEIMKYFFEQIEVKYNEEM